MQLAPKQCALPSPETGALHMLLELKPVPPSVCCRLSCS